MSDPYKVLGVSRDASDDDIKKAYRTLSRKYHPDANINNPNKDKAEEMFKLVQQAYDQIMNERKNGGAYTAIQVMAITMADMAVMAILEISVTSVILAVLVALADTTEVAAIRFC